MGYVMLCMGYVMVCMSYEFGVMGYGFYMLYVIYVIYLRRNPKSFLRLSSAIRLKASDAMI
jgi:hypothetical protein